MGNVQKISVRDVRNLMKSNSKALLVCGYEKEEDFNCHDVEGAISFGEFSRQMNSLSKDTPIIFYCACPNDQTAMTQAEKYIKKGFTNVKVIEGGFDAWKNAGCPVAATV